MPKDSYPGSYRGTVEDVNDPERRKRMRIRVHNIHPQEVPIENLPWAELALMGSKFVGDIPPFETQQVVFVVFEGGDKRYPVVVGGYFAFTGGIPDVPGEIDADYVRTQQRWVRVDKANNKITMSPLPEERWIELEAGEARLRLRQNDGVVEILTGSSCRIISPVIELNAEEQEGGQGGGELTEICSQRFAEIAEDGAIKCGETFALRAADKIQIGPYTDDLLIPYLTDVVEIDATSNIIINSRGTIDVDALQDITVDTPEDLLLTAQKNINIDGVAAVLITSTGDVTIDCDGKAIVDAQGNVEVKSAQQVTVDSGTSMAVTAGTSLTIDVQGGNADISVTGSCTLDVTGALDITSIGAMTLDAAAGLTLKSASKVTMEAPICEVKGQAQTALGETSGITQVAGSLIQIG